MVLVDTSVWIRFLSGRSPLASHMRRMLLSGEVWGHEFVYGELLIGDLGGRATTLAEYERMKMAPLLSHQEVVSFVRRHRFHGRGAGWIDIHLLASASAAGLRLWTVDPRLEALASELRIAYRPA